MSHLIQVKRGPVATLPIGSDGEILWTTDTNDLYVGNGAANKKLLTDAPSDGSTYGRLNGAWSAISSGSVPTGGTTGQVLAKNSNTNYDTGWVNQSGGGGWPANPYRILFRWKGNGDSTDSMPSINDGYIFGGVTYVAGLVGQAFSFNGSTGFVATYGVRGLGYTPYCVAGNNTSSSFFFSISMWFKTSTTSGGSMISFNITPEYTSATRDFPIFMTNAGLVGFGFYSSGVRLATSSSAYNDGNWHNVIAVLTDAGGSTLYVDGASKATNTQSGGIIGGWTGANLGFWRIGNGDFASAWSISMTSAFFAGLIQDVQIMRSALTSTQVSAIYAAGPNA
jgi:hypothetical protein